MKKMLIPAIALVFATFFPSQIRAASTKVEIKTVYEYRYPGLYDMADMYREPILFVFEYPVFSGPFAKKMEAAFAGKDDAEKKQAMPFERKKAYYSYEDYMAELSNVPDQHFDITTFIVEYDKNDVLSMTSRLDWYIGAVYDIVFRCHTFDLKTGRELEITDVLKGSKSEILSMVKNGFEAEYGELMDEVKYPLAFFLSSEGVNYVPDPNIIFGSQRGAVYTIPYSRKDLVKGPFGN
jgi:hypothetical protein